jgi:tRNA pseudouridine38-40 synthase
MPRYKIEIEYDGTDYSGWQRQPDQITIQEVIEQSLLKSFNQKVEIYGSGRTDAGVHAIAQIAHFDLDVRLDSFQMMMAINQGIPHKDCVSIVNCEIVDEDFHSRFHAKMRFYNYKICNRKACLALEKKRMWHVPQNLDLDKMKQASKYLLGQRDFSCFRDSEGQDKNPIRTINDIKIDRLNDVINFEVSAKSFLHHMVRNIVGTLYFVGKDKIKAEDVKTILESRDRTKSGPNAPAWGLYFTKVEY